MIKESSADAATAPQSLIVVQNWLEELKRLVCRQSECSRVPDPYSLLTE